MTIIRYGIAIFFVLILLAVGLSTASTSDNQDTSRVWKLGLGAVDPLTILKGDHWPISLIANSLIANTPQTIFSVLYFILNGVFSTMVLAAEWSDYAVHPKGLRVSTTPKGAQRSTYFLSLPYRYGIPLLILSTLIHWLMSQSLFLVAVQAYNPTHERDPVQDLTSCGYSPVAIISVVSVGLVMLSFLVALACRRLRDGMPVAGGDSMTISAACHPCHPCHGDESRGEELQAEEYLPLSWGATAPFPESDLDVGHCTFSGAEVEAPKEGFLYS